MIRVAVVEPEQSAQPLALPEGAQARVVARTNLSARGLDELVVSAARVVILDLRRTCTTQIGAMIRLLRQHLFDLRLVAVTAAGDDAAAQASIAFGAQAHLGASPDPLSLLRAVNFAARGALCLGQTGQRAVRRLRREDGAD